MTYFAFGTPAARSMFLGPDKPIAEVLRSSVNAPSFRPAKIPAIGLFTDARSLGRLCGLLASGGSLDGVELISERSIRRFAAEQVRGTDTIWASPVRLGLGYDLDYRTRVRRSIMRALEAPSDSPTAAPASSSASSRTC